MKLSARNKLRGKIVAIEEGAVNGIVVIDIGGGNKITSTISMGSIKELNLEVGSEAIAVIKATDVIVGVPE
ncbi:MAG: TOBE domain-containing protein [Syntrophomonadaceae bacterium]|nr:TOBE domain-containing protein [Syntrophomonadaceae bacterium]